MLEEFWDEEKLGRIPLQKRSQQRVETILEFSRKAIEREGVYALNLNNVAKEAGVNVASVYQFFPTKNAVIARLALREFDAHYSWFCQAAEKCDDLLDLRRVFTEGFLAIYEKSSNVVFMRELWAIVEADRYLCILNQKDDERIAKLFTEYYMRFEPGVDSRRVYNRALLLIGMCAFAARRAPQMLKDDSETMISEVIELVKTVSFTGRST